jgi:hypothetical protein
MANKHNLIGEFLSELENPEKLKAYLGDPEKTLRESGLSDEQQATLRSNDPAKIREALQAEYKDAKVMAFMVILAPMVIASPAKD